MLELNVDCENRLGKLFAYTRYGCRWYEQRTTQTSPGLHKLPARFNKAGAPRLQQLPLRLQQGNYLGMTAVARDVERRPVAAEYFIADYASDPACIRLIATNEQLQQKRKDE